MNFKTYEEKLLDPLWKARRLEIIARDGGRCYACGTKSGLEVHHWYYVAKRDLWDYPPDALTTVCGSCHKAITEQQYSNTSNWEVAACAVIRSVRETIKQSRQ